MLNDSSIIAKILVVGLEPRSRDMEQKVSKHFDQQLQKTVEQPAMDGLMKLKIGVLGLTTPTLMMGMP